MKEREGVRATPNRVALKLWHESAAVIKRRVAMTGVSAVERKALESGAEALFTKPIDFSVRTETEIRVERAA